DNKYKHLFVKIMQDAQVKFEFELNAFILMSNHCHLIITTVNEQDTISRIMQYVKMRVSRNWNIMNNEIGPFWNERFRSRKIDEKVPEFDLNWLLWYVAYNPVKKDIKENVQRQRINSKERVIMMDPRDFEFSSIKAYLDDDYESPVEITLHPLFLGLGKTPEKRLEEFLHFEALYIEKLYSTYEALL
ncbi:MAG: hypothetical protein GY750_13435, partial [Lentisphaerae bacterium]|nr:hypothetical protein [Lentisphaerota bacterium]